jgi:predicted esterase
LNIHNLNRMADYWRLADDASMTADQKLALAISGWVLGSGSGTENLAVALSLVEVRDAVVAYLRAKRTHEREAVLDRIRELEGGSPAYVAKILENIAPPGELPQEPVENIRGLYLLTVPGIEEQSEFQYYLQLPPEYDPARRYPCVVALHGPGTTPLHQIDWWAGTYSEKTQVRLGQAARHGYVVIAPHWQKPNQTAYEYSAREHAAVAYCLRDALGRVAIDTDRVFLSGHSMGGDAAWDIGISHPDLWAGVIPIVANGDRYIKHYSENARGVPLYFVGGALDSSWLQNNGSEFDRYLRRAGYDCTIVEYRGRGHEHFQDEIQRIFQWMELPSRKRQFFRREFTVDSMRPWDNAFWWLEIDGLPRASVVYPAEWPPPRGTRPCESEGRILDTNVIAVKARSDRVTVWLSPKMLSFERGLTVKVNGKTLRAPIQPSVDLMLWDVRARGDRQNPFWAKAEWPERR